MTKVEFDWKDYKLFIQEKGLDRKKAGTMKNEADFVAGAMCVMFFLEEKKELPSWWVLGTLANKELFTQEVLDSFKEEYYNCGDENEDSGDS